MSRRITGIPLSVALVRYRSIPLALLAVLGFSMAGCVVGASQIRDSARVAIEDSIRADLGHQTFATQTGNPAAVKVLAGDEGLSRVADEQGYVETAGLRTPALIRTFQQRRLALGVLLEGRRPKSSARGRCPRRQPAHWE